MNLDLVQHQASPGRTNPSTNHRSVLVPRSRPASAGEVFANNSATESFNTAALVSLAARIFLGLGWLRAGTEKLINPAWWDGTALRGFLENQHTEQLPFMEPLSRLFFEPAAPVIGIAVLVTQLAIGALFLSGRRLHVAVVIGMTLNIVFIAMGAVSPSAFYLVLELVVLVGISAHGLQVGGRRARTRIIALLAVSILLVPFVHTLEPGKVIEDPALMLITFFLLAALLQILNLHDGGRIVAWVRHTLLEVPAYGVPAHATVTVRTRPNRGQHKNAA